MLVNKFENLIAEYFGSRYAVAVDCCTHAIELCLRYLKSNNVTCPKHTYLSIPMTFKKLGLNWEFKDEQWNDYYFIGNTSIVDAAVLWKENSYIDNTFMCLSFQFKKHLNLGRGGMILLNDKKAYEILKIIRYDGRNDDSISWKDQNIEMFGYHYYMTPEIAEQGIKKFENIKNLVPKKWTYQDYPDITKMKVFSNA